MSRAHVHAPLDPQRVPAGAEAASASPVRVLLVDDSPLFLKGLASLLSAEPSIEVIGTAAHGAEAVAEADRLRPDVVLMDVQMPVMSGVAAATSLLERLPRIRVILLSGLWSVQSRSRLPPGVRATLSKNAGLEEMVAAILSGPATEPAAAGSERRRRDPGQATDRLSQREVHILSMLARGYHSARIAGELQLTQKTVRNYISVIYDKIGVHGRTGAVLHAVRTGLLDEVI